MYRLRGNYLKENHYIIAIHNDDRYIADLNIITLEKISIEIDYYTGDVDVANISNLIDNKQKSMTLDIRDYNITDDDIRIILKLKDIVKKYKYYNNAILAEFSNEINK